MRRVLLAVLCLALAGAADMVDAGLNANTKLYSQCETKWLCNGVEPDAGYTGCTFREITLGASGVLADSTLGDSKPASDSVVVIGRVAAVKHFGMLRFDLSPIPDSAVVAEARLYVTVLSTAGTSISRPEMLYFCRVMRDWDTGVTWNTRLRYANGALVDTTWLVAGAADTAGNGDYYGGIASSILTRNCAYHTPGTHAVAMVAQELNWSTPDSVFQDIGEDSVSTADIDSWGLTGASSTSLSFTGASPMAVGRVAIDVTRDVRNWHTGNWANDGWKMRWTGTNACYFTLGSSDSPTLNNRPRLLVKYLFAEPFPPDTVTVTLGRRHVVAGME
jgi:hypothetical protein